MSTAREHAIVASQLLGNVDSAQEEIREYLADDMRHTEAIATGLIKRHNDVVAFTLQMASAHALAALALAATGAPDD